MNRNIFIACLFCIGIVRLNAQDISFFKEDITFRIEKSCFFVNGIYSLRNNGISVRKIVLFYPFPTDSIYSSPDSLFVYNITTGQEITNCINKEKGIIFNLDVDSTTDLCISYRQQLKSNEAKYILTTTKQWGEAFETVTYKLIINNMLQIKTFSYAPDKYEEFGDTIIYYWVKKNFMPLKDMIFTFQ